MSEFSICVDPAIFNQFPGYIRGIVIGHNLKNSPSSGELIQMLRDAENDLRTRLQIEQITEDGRIKAWREAYRSFGAKPSEFRSSIEAMARRVLRNDPLPSINTLVDIGNIISLRYLLPTGSHAIDHLKNDLVLRPASGNEDFNPFGTDIHEQPLAGEVVFCEGPTVLTRRWTWRQANQTLTLPETRDIEFNVDGLPPTEFGIVENACKELVELIQLHCGGDISSGYLTPSQPSLSLTK